MPASTESAVLASFRFGLGPKPGELDTISSDPRGWAAAQLNRRPVPLTGDLSPSQVTVAAMLEARKDKLDKPEFRQKMRAAYLAEIDARMTAAILGDTPVLERLTYFWSNHFTVSGIRPLVLGFSGAFEREAIRPHVTGRFADMLLASTRHPAMLLYLDNAESIGPDSQAGQRRNKGINENLGRELLELHTLGVDGGYSQADVDGLANILTGWTVAPLRLPEPGTFRFIPQIHQPGSKTLLGRVYREGGESEALAALTDLAHHPATARHIATKLARHFIVDVPPADAVQRIARVFSDTGGDLKAVTRALMREEAAWRAPYAKLRTPNDLLVSAYRAVGVVPPPEQVTAMLKTLGQMPFLAPSPAGWPDSASDWISPESVVRRADWCQVFAQRLDQPPDPLAVMQNTFGDTLPQEVQQAVQHAPDKRMALALLTASPQFQRR